MKWTEYIPIAAAIVAILVSIAGVIRERRKPALDAAQANSALVNSDAVKQQIKKMSDESNVRRDLRILDLEEWADAMRPWSSEVQAYYAMLVDIVKAEMWEAGHRELPGGLPTTLPAPPEFPKPRPLGA